jgi:hypothetical protein
VGFSVDQSGKRMRMPAMVVRQPILDVPRAPRPPAARGSSRGYRPLCCCGDAVALALKRHLPKQSSLHAREY